MREPKIKNKYNLKPPDIKNLKILKPERLKEKPFWRNNVIQAYCISGNTIHYFNDIDDSYDEYWIGFYDKNAKRHAGEIVYRCSSFSGMCNYTFQSFFDYKEIETEMDLEVQEKLLKHINWLLDEGIVTL